jgi:hypothetical protein
MARFSDAIPGAEFRLNSAKTQYRAGIDAMARIKN